MQFKAISLTLFVALIAPTALGASTATTVSVSFDQAYDNADASLTTVSCSDGSHGLLTKGYTTFGSLPSFPNIGGASVVPGWNSDQCGTCWALSYNGKSINVLAVDSATDGWNIGLEAMNALTDGQAQQLGRVDAIATLVDSAQCGL
ncbi:Cerato-platanin [Ganoderma leucocontextum]|nr:Cerato-platanin [Ganoderma leucocontextum]